MDQGVRQANGKVAAELVAAEVQAQNSSIRDRAGSRVRSGRKAALPPQR